MKTRAGLLAIGIGLVLSPESRAQTTLEADLVGSSDSVPPWIQTGAVAQVVVEGQKVTLTITPDEVADPMPRIAVGQGPVIEPMAVHIHKGGAGANGRLVVGFTWTSSTYLPSVTVIAQASRTFAAKAAANPQGYYVDVHTSDFPAGAARGQLHAPVARSGPVAPSQLHLDGQALQPGVGIGSEMQLPGRGVVGLGWAPAARGPMAVGGPRYGARPAPRPPQLPSRMTWEFFFHHVTRADERAAILTEAEGPVLEREAVDCAEALAQLDASPQPEETPGSAAADPIPSPDERSRILDAHVAQLRSRLGEAAFVSLSEYIRKRFDDDEEDASTPGPPSLRRRADQTLTFRRVPYKIYGDSDFRLVASASSGLRVYFTASGDCSVVGSVVHILSAGSCQLTAHQPGNESFNPAPAVTQQLKIRKAAQRISFPAIGPRAYREPDIPASAFASSGLLVVVNAVGKCTVHRGMVHLLGAGTCFLSAHQPGSPNYEAAPIVDQEFPVAPANQTILLPAFDNPPYGPSDIRLEPRASSDLPVRISTEGACAFTGTLLQILRSGTCKLTANQSGNADYKAAPTETRVFEVVWREPEPEPVYMESGS